MITDWKLAGLASLVFFGLGGGIFKWDTGVFHARDNDDLNYVNIRAASPVVANDLTTKLYVDAALGSLPVTPSLTKGQIITNNGAGDVATGCPDGKILEWELGQTNGNKCIDTPTSTPVLVKGEIITNNGSNDIPTSCPNGQLLEWDSTQPNGNKCIVTPVSGGVTVVSATILNNQIAPADVTGLTIDVSKYGFLVDYTVRRKSFSPDSFALNVPFNTNAIEGSKLIGDLVFDVAVEATGHVMISGVINSYAGNAGSNHLVRLDSNGLVDGVFMAAAVNGSQFNNTVRTVAVHTSGDILAGGFFTGYGITSAKGIVKLSTTGVNDVTFASNINFDVSGNNVYDIAVQNDGKIIMAGNFTHYNTVSTMDHLVRLNADGTLDAAFSNNSSTGGIGGKFDNQVNSVAIQADGKILVVGDFDNYNFVAGRTGLIRLNSDGTEDTAFSANATDGMILSNANIEQVYTDNNKIAIVGAFSSYGGVVGRNQMVLLNMDGTLDAAFTANSTDGSKFNNCLSAFIDSSGGVFVGGNFTNYGGFAGRQKLVHLNSDGTLDTGFANTYVDGSKFNKPTYSTVENTTSNTFYFGGDFDAYPLLVNGDSLLSLNFVSGGINEINETGTLKGFVLDDSSINFSEIGVFADAGIDFSFLGNQLQYTTTDMLSGSDTVLEQTIKLIKTEL